MSAVRRAVARGSTETLNTMPSIPDFWDLGRHEPLPVEPTWDEFVQASGGRRVSGLFSESLTIENADYLFETHGVVAELKEIETEFARSAAVCVNVT